MVLFHLEKYTNASASVAGENKIIMAYHKLLMFSLLKYHGFYSLVETTMALRKGSLERTV